MLTPNLNLGEGDVGHLSVMYGNALCFLGLSRGIGSHILYLIRYTAVHNACLWVL